ncbi:DMT family transporter [Chachezhania sediminis]|uniref:DMT family transporter n=1 Tax=Chachezhania sediminis TaxID=2599291 RepID=UPI00131C5A71|nr:DMT family transporter [Chachezhania sediminis]
MTTGSAGAGTLTEHGTQVAKAVALLLGAILCFDAMSILVRILSDHYSPAELSAYRNVVGVLPSLALLVYTGELSFRKGAFRIEQWPLAILRGIAVACAQWSFYGALAVLEIATVSALSQINAVFVVLLSIVVLGEKVGPWRWLAVGLGFAGALMILKPGSDAFSWYALLPILAAACYAFSMVTVRKFTPETSNAMIYLYSSAAAAVGAVILAGFTTEFSPIRGWVDLALVLAMGIIGGTGVLIMMLAYRMAAAAVLAPFTYFSLLTAFLVGWIVFGEFPVEKLFPGVLLIVVAGGVIMWRENRARGA